MTLFTLFCFRVWDAKDILNLYVVQIINVFWVWYLTEYAKIGNLISKNFNNYGRMAEYFIFGQTFRLLSYLWIYLSSLYLFYYYNYSYKYISIYNNYKYIYKYLFCYYKQLWLNILITVFLHASHFFLSKIVPNYPLERLYYFSPFTISIWKCHCVLRHLSSKKFTLRFWDVFVVFVSCR